MFQTKKQDKTTEEVSEMEISNLPDKQNIENIMKNQTDGEYNN